MTKKVIGEIRGFALLAALALAFALTLALASPAHAETITVDSLDDGTLVTDGNCTLREGITNANKDDQSGSIDCAAGSGSDVIRVGVTGMLQLDGALPELSSDLRIEGPGADGFTVRRDSGGVYRIFTVTSGSVVSISGITISGGNAPNSSGGGIHNREGTLTVTGSTISGNLAGLGGGVFSDTFLSGTQKSTITYSTISGNSATDTGGGVHRAVASTTSPASAL